MPVHGFDRGGSRLGYGGSYFDGTLVALEPVAVAIGLGYEPVRMETIFLRWHDVAFDFIVTRGGIHLRGGSRSWIIDPAEATDAVGAIVEAGPRPHRSRR